MGKLSGAFESLKHPKIWKVGQVRGEKRSSDLEKGHEAEEAQWC